MVEKEEGESLFPHIVFPEKCLPVLRMPSVRSDMNPVVNSWVAYVGWQILHIVHDLFCYVFSKEEEHVYFRNHAPFPPCLKKSLLPFIKGRELNVISCRIDSSET